MREWKRYRKQRNVGGDNTLYTFTVSQCGESWGGRKTEGAKCSGCDDAPQHMLLNLGAFQTRRMGSMCMARPAITQNPSSPILPHKACPAPLKPTARRTENVSPTPRKAERVRRSTGNPRTQQISTNTKALRAEFSIKIQRLSQLHELR